MNTKSLLEEFQGSNYGEWRKEAERLLKGKPFDKTLLTRTHEGIELQPLYDSENIKGLEFARSMPGYPPYVRGTKKTISAGKRWEIAQEFVCPGCDEFNKYILDALNRGMTAVNLPLDVASRMGEDPRNAQPGDIGRGGISVASIFDLDAALRDVDLATTPVYLQTGASGMPYLGIYIALAKKRGVDLTELNGAIGMDPIGVLVNEGRLAQPLRWAYVSMMEMTSWANQNAPNLGTTWIHGEPYSEAGGTAIQELAFVISTAVEYLRELEKLELAPDNVVPHMRFSFSQGSNFFMEIAKLRAARLVWNRVLEASNIPPEKRNMWIHARTSRYTKTDYDPYVNMLRDTTEALSGIAGGANSIHIAAFDEHSRKPNEFSRRIARDLQYLLKEESHLGEVTDPGGGSWYIENLTSQIAQKAWELFQEVEKHGGIANALEEGFPQEQVKNAGIKRADDYATRKDVLIGTNKYPNADDDPVDPIIHDLSDFVSERKKQLDELCSTSNYRENAETFSILELLSKVDTMAVANGVIEATLAGATVGEIASYRTEADNIPVNITPILRKRASEPFEELRRRVEKHCREKEKLKIFLATLGPVGKYMPRLDFAASFFEVSGFPVTRTLGYNSPDEAANATKADNPRVAVICGLDEVYEDQAPQLATILKNENPGIVVYMAGLPKDEELAGILEKSGVDSFIHTGSDVLETLNKLAEKLGVENE